MSDARNRDQRRAENYGRFADLDLQHVPPADVCDPGIKPLEYNLIIAPAVMPEKFGAIHLPDEARQRMEMALQVGRIVRMSPLAFNYDHLPPAAMPKPGDIVWFARYAGGELTGRDGRLYRVIKDKDVGGLVETDHLEPPAADLSQASLSAAAPEAVPTTAEDLAALKPLELEPAAAASPIMPLGGLHPDLAAEGREARARGMEAPERLATAKEGRDNG